MTKKRLTALLVTALGLVAGPSAPSAGQRWAAEYYYHTGLVCQPPHGHAGNVDYRENGVGNASTSAVAEVFCPAFEGSDGFLQLDWIEVAVVDASNTGAVSCYMYGSDADSNTLWSPTRSTTTADPPSPGWWTGATKLLFDPGQILQGDWTLQRMNWSVRCYLPPQTANGTRSWVKQLLVGADDDWRDAE
ncbi:MAG TPA: hypothetical protein VM261_26070 [Kofleriaceae bacterium]|nr:hypothetical protein [Kofleriaceae bacterium]